MATFFQKLGLAMLVLVLMATAVGLGLQAQDIVRHTYFLAPRLQTDHERSLSTDFRPLAADLLKQVEWSVVKLSLALSLAGSAQAMKDYRHEFIPTIIILIFFRFFQNSRSVSRTDFSAVPPVDRVVCPFFLSW